MIGKIQLLDVFDICQGWQLSLRSCPHQYIHSQKDLQEGPVPHPLPFDTHNAKYAYKKEVVLRLKW